MQKADVRIIVCGRFHYHKFVHLLQLRGVLNKFIYSYKLNFDFRLPKKKLQNYPVKEYLMYAGRKFIKGKAFFKYLMTLHTLWQKQVLLHPCSGNIAHFLIHGNCDKIILKYKKKGVLIIGEVVNIHPYSQRDLLSAEYKKFGLQYESLEQHMEDKIIREYNLCDYLLTPSQYVKKSLIGHGMNGEKIKVIPYGIDTDMPRVQKSRQIKKNQEIRLLCISQVTFRKGIVYLFEALDLLQKKGYQCKLTLIGNLDPVYLNAINNIPVSLNINHISHTDNSTVKEFMLANDLFVMPSIEDGFGIVVSEALSVQLPVIVTQNCGAAEIVTEGKDGFVVVPFSAVSIAEAVIKSIDHVFECRNKLFSWDDYVSELSGFYSQILN